MSSWSDLPRRLTTICVGVPLLWMLWWDDNRRWIFFQGVHLIMALEWTSMTKMPAAWAAIFITASLTISNLQHDAVLPVIVALVCISQQQQQQESVLFEVIIGFILLSIPHRSWLYIAQQDFYHTILVLLTAWNGDTGALVTGRCIGHLIKSPIWLQRISPSKSLLGLCGGVLGACLTFVSMPALWDKVLYKFSPTSESRIDFTGSNFILFGLLLGILAVMGDLWESSLKRRYKVKDSGAWLPGHGGILDRFDSSLLVVMAYHWLLQQQQENMSKD